MTDPIRRGVFAAKYRHRFWGVVLAVPAGVAALLALGFAIGTLASQSTYYLPSSIAFLIPTLAFGLPAIYLLRGREIDPRPEARRAAAAARREAQLTASEAERAAREADLLIRKQTAEANRDAAVAQRDAAQAAAQAAEAQRMVSTAEQRVDQVGDAGDAASPSTSPTGLDSPTATAEWVGQEVTINRIAGYMRASGILWMVLGILQVAVGLGFAFAAGLTLALVIIGVWNLVAATSRLNSVALIKNRDASVPAAWEGAAGLVVVGVANLLIGGLIGVAFVIFDFVVRDQILRSRALFVARDASGVPA